MYKQTRAIGNEKPLVAPIFSSKISSLKYLQIAGPTVFERNFFSKLMLSADYIVSTMHSDSTTPKSITLLKGMQQIGNLNVKLVELELTDELLQPVELFTEESDVQDSVETETEWTFQYLPAAPANRLGFGDYFFDLQLDGCIIDIGEVLNSLRSRSVRADLPEPSNDQKRELRDAGRELVPLVADLQAIKSKYHSDDVAEMQVNEGYKSIEQIWRRIWFGHTSQNPTQLNQYGPRIL